MTEWPIERFPEAFREDLRTAITMLKSLGATNVYVFGSLVQPRTATPPRDIDLAVEGLPKRHFYTAYGRLLMQLDHDIDLIDLDNPAAFVQRLKELGRLERVA